MRSTLWYGGTMRSTLAPFAAVGFAALVACGSPASRSSESVGEQQATDVDSNDALFTQGGGCYPPLLTAQGIDLLAAVDPEWAPVVNGAIPFSDPVLVHGTVIASQVTREDFPSTHVTFDQNTFLHLDPSDAGFLATGNALLGDNPVEVNALEMEWETGFYPAWAWAGEGDRVVALGRWIFDCGHPDPTRLGTCTDTGAPCLSAADCGLPITDPTICRGAVVNYRSELHPPQAVAVVRAGRGAVLHEGDAAVPATRADVYISGEGGGAGDLCVVTHVEPVEALLVVNCFPLSLPLALIPLAEGAPAPLNSRDFDFDVPLPLNFRGFVPAWRVIPHDTPTAHGVAIPATFDIAAYPLGPSPHLHVTVHMTASPDGSAPTGFAATILAGWERPRAPELAHMCVSVESVQVRDPLKPETFGILPPRGWKLQVAVNGEWQELGPALAQVDAQSAGVTFPVDAVFEQWLLPHGDLRIQAQGGSRTCADDILNQSLGTDLLRFGQNPLIVQACIATREEPDPGRVDVTFSAPSFGVGQLEIPSRGGDATACAMSGAPCSKDADCGAGDRCVGVGAYSMSVRIARQSDPCR